MRPASNAASGTPIDPTTQSENNSLKSELEALKKLCAEQQKRLDEMYQLMINPVS
jgi:hypothetical protein